MMRDRGVRKFVTEKEKYPFGIMRERYRFISYDELESFVEVATPFHELKIRLFGEE